MAVVGRIFLFLGGVGSVLVTILATILATTLGTIQSSQAQALFSVSQRFSISSIFTDGLSIPGDFNLDGVPDVVSPRSLIFPGTNPGFGLVHMIDEHGDLLAQTDTAPIPAIAQPMLPGIKGGASADFNGDGWPDLAGVTTQGLVVVSLNQRQNKTTSGFGTVTPIADLSAMMPPSSFGLGRVHLKVADLNGDGKADLIVFGGFCWSQVYPFGVTTLLGNGDGTFQAPVFSATVLQSPSPLTADVEWVDLDGDGTPETLVSLQEVINPSNYVQQVYLEYFQWTGASGSSPALWSSVALHQILGMAGKPTALGFGDVDGDGVKDWVISGTVPHQNGKPTSDVWIFPGISGTPYGFNVSGYPTLALPASGYENDLLGLKVLDLNKDGTDDIIAINARGSLQNAELVYFLNSGTGQSVTQVHRLDLGAFMFCPHSGLTILTNYPTHAHPEALAVSDFSWDGAPDFFVGDLKVTQGGANYTYGVSIRNLTPTSSGVGTPIFELMGNARANRAGDVLLTGSSGGAPTVGNSKFAITLNDVPGDGTVVGLNGADFPIGPIPIGPTIGGLDVDVYPYQSSALWMLSHTGPATGFVRYALPIPNDPNLVGYEAWFQFLYADPLSGAAYPIYDSKAVHLRVGSAP